MIVIMIVFFKIQILIHVYFLQTAYNKKDSVYKFVRQLLALLFLLPEHIEETFLRLDGRAPEVLAPVMDYMCTGRGSVLPSSRFITGVYSWHPSGQTMMWRGVTTAWTPVLPLGDRFLSTIFCSSCTGKQPAITVQMKMVSEGKIQRYQRKRTLQVEGRVFQLWNDYCERSISASELLKGCASVYGPPAS